MFKCLSFAKLVVGHSAPRAGPSGCGPSSRRDGERFRGHDVCDGRSLCGPTDLGEVRRGPDQAATLVGSDSRRYRFPGYERQLLSVGTIGWSPKRHSDFRCRGGSGRCRKEWCSGLETWQYALRIATAAPVREPGIEG
jgi:hypothetical protein